jgi:membrane protein implicated in regulation of membrane protease activity
MLDWLPPIGPWHWLILGLVLAALELVTPAFLFLPMGIGAGAVGLMLALFPEIPWSGQLGVFAAVSVISVLVGRGYLRRHPITSDEPTLNRRGHQYVGRVFTLDAPIVNGVGKIRVDDSTWKVVGPDVPAGVRVRVSGVDGTVLRVDAVEVHRGGT